MAEGGNQNSQEGDSVELNQPAWFTPERMLVILCLINLLNYIDRGAIASNGVNGLQGNSTCVDEEKCFQGSGIVGDFSLSYFQDGILSSTFMVGLLIASPIFAELSKTFNPMRLIGVGLAVWTVATAGCGISMGFWSIAIFRMLLGVAEASFISLAAPFIDDYAPPGKRTSWLSLFYSCIPVGVALGYVYGGVVGGAWGWRSAFWIESLFMLPFVIFGFVSNPVHLKGRLRQPSHSTALLKGSSGGASHVLEERGIDGGGEQGTISSRRHPTKFWAALGEKGSGLLEDLKRLSAQKIYVVAVLGYVAYNFVIGAYAYWGPKVGEALFGIDNADIVFGAVTIFSGILGTLFGGFALDHIGSTIPNAFKFLSIVTCFGGVMCLISFTATSLKWFIPLFGIGEFCLFGTQGPVNYVTLHSVPRVMRPLAIAISTVSIHIFGDVPSSPIVGIVQDVIENWRLTSELLTAVLFIGSALWACGILLRPEAEDIVIEKDGRQVISQEETEGATLLGTGP